MFELLDHPADIGFRAFGETLPALFANCAAALVSIATDVALVEPATGYPISVSSGDRESLLVDWLSEVLYWLDGKGIVFRRFEVARLDGASLRATGFGEPFDPQHHRMNVIVKAVTYHQLRIGRREGRWFAEVYLDI